MRRAFLIIMVAVFAASLAFAQAGPKQKNKAKPVPKNMKEEEKPEKVNAKLEKTEVNKTTHEKAESSSHLKRALFTTAIEKREPVSSVDSLSTENEKVYFFSEITGLQGHTIIHRWMLGDDVHAEVPIVVGGPRWRAYSSKKLLPAWTGEWIVEVVDADGYVYGKKRFIYFSAKGDKGTE